VFLSEAQGGTQPDLYLGNDTQGRPVNRAASATGAVFRSNVNYNPVGPLTAPGVPASTTPLTNTTGVDATVYLNGGTVSAVAVGGTSTGQGTNTPYRVPAGQTITLTYTVAPTWAWFGD
jgi:hypothetical protein